MNLREHEVKLSGRDLVNLASSKIAFLSRWIDRIQETLESSKKNPTIPKRIYESMELEFAKQVKDLEESIQYCEVIKKYITDNQEVTLTLRDLNFLENTQVYKIDG